MMKRTLLLEVIFFLSIGCTSIDIGNTGYYLFDDGQEGRIKSHLNKDFPEELNSATNEAAYYNDDYMIVINGPIITKNDIDITYYIVKINKFKDKVWVMNNKEDYFKIRDSLGLDEKKMSFVKW